LEYILILVVILAAILLAGAGIRNALKDKLFNAETNVVNKAASVLANSYN